MHLRDLDKPALLPSSGLFVCISPTPQVGKTPHKKPQYLTVYLTVYNSPSHEGFPTQKQP